MNEDQTIQPVFVAGEWRASAASQTFRAINPATSQDIGQHYPISNWQDIDAALSAASDAAKVLSQLSGKDIAAFLERCASKIESSAQSICEQANLETALPLKPRLLDVEMPRTLDQLRQAAKAAREESWRSPMIDTSKNIRSMFAPIGPVAIFGPNNFPLAFNAISGGDFAAAIAAKNPVIAKAHPLQPGTSQLLCECIASAMGEMSDLIPPGAVQMLYGMDSADGLKMVQDARIAAVAFTGSRKGGLAIKAAADSAGKPAYLEMSSINPVVLLPGALEESADNLAEQFASSCLMAAGQFCTNPGLILLIKSETSSRFIIETTKRFDAAAPGTLFGSHVRDGLTRVISDLESAGAIRLTSAQFATEPRISNPNTLLQVSGSTFLQRATSLSIEAFGNAALIVVCDDVDQLLQVIYTLEGQLTGTIYSSKDSRDDEFYAKVERSLRPRVGRLSNDKMPTGVAVSPAMQHGGPYPATGHAGFTAVGIPASIRRFTQLQCYDGVRPARLPEVLRDENPLTIWRNVDGEWTRNAIQSK